jgi:hypothetical protein
MTGKGIKEQTLSILLTIIFILNTWNEILLDVQVIKYLSTLEIMHKLEYSIDYRHKILFFINTEISNIAMKVNPKVLLYLRVVY